jgi:hypothetical protein
MPVMRKPLSTKNRSTPSPALAMNPSKGLVYRMSQRGERVGMVQDDQHNCHTANAIERRHMLVNINLSRRSDFQDGADSTRPLARWGRASGVLGNPSQSVAGSAHSVTSNPHAEGTATVEPIVLNL